MANQPTTNFFEHYRNLESQKEKNTFRKRVITCCEIEPSTFYLWTTKHNIPNSCQILICMEFKADRNVFFPKKLD